MNKQINKLNFSRNISKNQETFQGDEYLARMSRDAQEDLEKLLTQHTAYSVGRTDLAIYDGLANRNWSSCAPPLESLSNFSSFTGTFVLFLTLKTIVAFCS